MDEERSFKQSRDSALHYHGRSPLKEMSPRTPMRTPLQIPPSRTILTPLASNSGKAFASSFQQANSFYARHSSGGGGSLKAEKLSIEEIVKELDKLGLEVPEDFWKSPKPEDVQGLYSAALEETFSLTQVDVRVEELAPESGNGSLANPSLKIITYDGKLHLHAIGTLRFFRYCEKLCKTIFGIPGFNKDYLFKPTPVTVIQFANAFVHYLKFRDWLCNSYEDQFQKVKDQANEDIKADEKKLALEKELSRVSAAYEESMKEMERRQKLLASAEDKIKQLGDQFHSSSEKLAKLQEEQVLLEGKLQDLNMHLHRLGYKKNELKDLIVISPETIASTRDDAIRKKEEAKQSIRRLEQLKNSMNDQINARMKVEKRFNKLESILNDYIEPNLQLINQYKTSLNNTKHQLTQARKDRAKQQEVCDALQISIKSLEDSHKSSSEYWSSLIEAAEEALATSQGKVEQHKQFIKAHYEETVAIRAHTQKLQIERDNLQREASGVQKKLDFLLQSLRDAQRGFTEKFYALEERLMRVAGKKIAVECMGGGGGVEDDLKCVRDGGEGRQTHHSGGFVTGGDGEEGRHTHNNNNRGDGDESRQTHSGGFASRGDEGGERHAHTSRDDEQHTSLRRDHEQERYTRTSRGDEQYTDIYRDEEQHTRTSVHFQCDDEQNTHISMRLRRDEEQHTRTTVHSQQNDEQHRTPHHRQDDEQHTHLPRASFPSQADAQKRVTQGPRRSSVVSDGVRISSNDVKREMEDFQSKFDDIAYTPASV